MDLKEMRYKNVDWYKLVQNRIQYRARMSTVMNFRVDIIKDAD